jgi:hypothetical protein
MRFLRLFAAELLFGPMPLDGTVRFYSGGWTNASLSRQKSEEAAALAGGSKGELCTSRQNFSAPAGGRPLRSRATSARHTLRRVETVKHRQNLPVDAIPLF